MCRSSASRVSSASSTTGLLKEVLRSPLALPHGFILISTHSPCERLYAVCLMMLTPSHATKPSLTEPSSTGSTAKQVWVLKPGKAIFFLGTIVSSSPQILAFLGPQHRLLGFGRRSRRVLLFHRQAADTRLDSCEAHPCPQTEIGSP